MAENPGARGKARILTYHRVGSPREGRTERLTVPPRRFARQLRLLSLLRTRFARLDEVASWLAGSPPQIGQTLALTFDDGYRDLCEHALPRLVARKTPALVFLVAGRQEDSWMDWGARGPLPLMDWPAIREFAEHGIEFGSHSISHPDLTRLSDRELRTEVADSKQIIQDQLGAEIHHFCYPYGAFDERVTAAVQEAGYATACTTRRGAVRAGADPFRLPRLSVGKTMGLRRFLVRSLLAR